MPLTDQQLALVRTSFEALRNDPVRKSDEFYGALFAAAPGLRGLFRDDVSNQGMRFMSTLAVIVDNLHDPTALDERYANLGRGHAAMGVRAGDFEPMKTALINTLAKALGQRFDLETRIAWETAYDDFSSAIIRKGRIPL